MNLRLAEFVLVYSSARVRYKFGSRQSGSLHIAKQDLKEDLTLLFLKAYSWATPHSHHRLVVGSSPTALTIPSSSGLTSQFADQYHAPTVPQDISLPVNNLSLLETPRVTHGEIKRL
jgi:hypothetical protein